MMFVCPNILDILSIETPLVSIIVPKLYLAKCVISRLLRKQSYRLQNMPDC